MGSSRDTQPKKGIDYEKLVDLGYTLKVEAGFYCLFQSPLPNPLIITDDNDLLQEYLEGIFKMNTAPAHC